MFSETKIMQRIERMEREIREDNIHGATFLLGKAADTIMYMAEHMGDLSNDWEKMELVDRTLDLLKSSQPLMAPIVNLCLNIEKLVKSFELDDIPEKIREEVREFTGKCEIANDLIAKLVFPLIPDGATIMTHSYSSTLLRSISYAEKAFKRTKVICTESRPKMEGKLLADSLAEEGIEVTLIVDSAVFKFMDQTDIIMVGADHVTDNGLTNKIGTLGISSFAKKEGIPCYALCQHCKIIPAKYISTESMKDPDEIADDLRFPVGIENFYFDTSPLENFSGIITEKGIMGRDDILKITKTILEGLSEVTS